MSATRHFLMTLAVLVAVAAPHLASAEVQGTGSTSAAAPAALGGGARGGAVRGATRGASRGVPRGAPRGRGTGPGLRGASGVPSQKVSGAVPPLKTATSQKLDAELEGKMGDLTLERKGPAESDVATVQIIGRLLACTSPEARATVAKELVTKVSELGVGGLETLNVMDKLSNALDEVGKIGHKRAGALVALDEILTVFGTSAEPWTLELLSKVLDSVGHKAADVRTPATSVANRMFDLLSDQAVRLVLPAVIFSLSL